jgi:hypothetical protein
MLNTRLWITHICLPNLIGPVVSEQIVYDRRTDRQRSNPIKIPFLGFKVRNPKNSETSVTPIL